MAVNIWDVCYRSEKPLSIEEIAAELDHRGLRFVTDALMFFKQHESPGRAALWRKWGNESPPPETVDEAWLAYVAHLVGQCSHSYFLTSRVEEGFNPKNTRAPRRYSANTDKPPKVYRQVISVERTLVPYDPDKRDEANRGHAAGIDFLNELANLDVNRKRHPVPADVRALLALAEKAIRARPSDD
jgi:hypothetical protein